MNIDITAISKVML